MLGLTASCAALEELASMGAQVQLFREQPWELQTVYQVDRALALLNFGTHRRVSKGQCGGISSGSKKNHDFISLL